MRHASANQPKENTQAGVTLLLAVLVLSSVLAISFSLATILMIEVRSSGDLMKTEPSLYASQGVTEEAIYRIKRKTNIAIPATTVGSTQVSAPVEQSTTSPVQTLRIVGPKTYNTSESRLNFFNADDPSSSASGYAKVSITYHDTGNTSNLKIYLCHFGDTTFNPCSTSTDFYLDAYNFPVTRGTTKTYSINPSERQELVLVNESSSPMYATIESYGPTASDPKGLPFLGETQVEVQATNGGLTRTLQTRVPVD